MVYSHLVTRIYLRAKCRHQYREHMGSIPVPGGIRAVNLFLSCEFCFYCLRVCLVCLMSMSMHCPFLVASSAFSEVYLTDFTMLGDHHFLNISYFGFVIVTVNWHK